MTVQELHIDLDLKLQKINSNSTQNIEKEEKDWFINNQVIEFLTSRIRDFSDEKKLGFQEDFKRQKDLQGLVTKKSLNVEYLNEKEGKVILPSFNFSTIRTDFYMFKKCKESEYTKVEKIYNKIKFELPKGEHFKIDIIVFQNNQSLTLEIFDTENYNDFIIEEKNYFYLIELFNNVIANFNKNNKDIQFYYENFGEESSQSSYFVNGLNNNLNTLSITKDNTILNLTPDNINIINYESNYTIKKPGNIVNTEIEGFLSDSNFSQSTLSRPYGVNYNGILKVLHPNKSIIKNIDLYYVKQPQKVNVNLNINLDFNDDICREIINNTVVTIKNLIDENRFEDFKNNFKQIE